MLGLFGVVNAMALWRHEEIAKRPVVGLQVAVVGVSVETLRDEQPRKQRQVEPQHHHRHEHDGHRDGPVDRVHPVVGEDVHFALRVMDGVKDPEHRHLVPDEVMEPVQEVRDDEGKHDPEPVGKVGQPVDRQEGEVLLV